MDESGNKESDRYFVCGFLEIQDNQDFSVQLQRVRDQIFDLSLRNRQRRVDDLLDQKEINQLHKLAKNFSEFELKHYLISSENQKLYTDLIKVLIRKTKFRFTAIVFDRHDPNYVRPENKSNLYLKCFKLFCRHSIKSDYVFVPDSFDDGFNWQVVSGKKPSMVLPLNSKSCLQLQIVDLLTGLVAQALRIKSGEVPTKKDLIRKPVLETLEAEIKHEISPKFTINSPQYFNVWRVKLK